MCDCHQTGIICPGYIDDAVSFERNASTGALTYGGMLKNGVNGVDVWMVFRHRGSTVSVSKISGRDLEMSRAPITLPFSLILG